MTFISRYQRKSCWGEYYQLLNPIYPGDFVKIKITAFLSAIAVCSPIAFIQPASAAKITSVSTTITPEGNYFRYNFTLKNDSTAGEQIRAWDLPLFSLNDIIPGSITSPGQRLGEGSTFQYYRGWNYGLIQGTTQGSPVIASDIVPLNARSTSRASKYYFGWEYNAANDYQLVANPGQFGPNPQAFENPPYVIHWLTGFGYAGAGGFDGYLYNVDGEGRSNPDGSSDNSSITIVTSPTPLYPGQSQSGFSFLSRYSDQNAPYQAYWNRPPVTIGDPPIPGELGFSTPNSPARQAAQDSNPTIPTPALLPGLVSMGVGSWLKRRKQDAAASSKS
jgi:hypothetical protein